MRFSRVLSSILLGVSLAAGAAAQTPQAFTPSPGSGAAPAPPMERPVPTARPSGDPGKSMMFQIALVQADNLAGALPQQAVPKGVQKALADIQDFLPFKSYRLLDSSLVRGSGEAHARLTGPNEQEYDAGFMFREAGDGILIDPFNLVKTPKPSGQPLPPGAAPRALEPTQTSSFRIRRGETVVVGSSRINDSSALIVVLTALP